MNIILNKYIIDKVLHSSCNGKVYLARHMQLGVMRVIKEIIKDSVYSDNFYMEINVLKNLRHSSIPIIYDIEQDKDRCYIIEEYIEGISLYRMITSNGRISESKAIDYGCQIAGLIAFLHSNESNPILFLDLQPQNIIINNDKIYLVDFGGAMIKNVLERSKIYGTCGYAAPEQYEGSELSEETDIYGIGGLLCYMVTAANPKEGIGILLNNDSISCRFKRIILKCIKEQKKYRYKDADTLLKQLMNLRFVNELQNVNNTYNDETPLYISVVGIEHKVGTTHLAFQLARYLDELGYDVVYKENNSSGHMRCFINEHSECVCESGVFIYRNLRIVPNYESFVDITYGAQVVVLDEGVYEQRRHYSDIVFLVSGSSEWEIHNTRNTLENENIHTGIIFNMCNMARYNELLDYFCIYDELYHCSVGESMTGKINKELFDNLLKGVVKSQSDTPRTRFGRCIAKIKEKINRQ